MLLSTSSSRFLVTASLLLLTLPKCVSAQNIQNAQNDKVVALEDLDISRIATGYGQPQRDVSVDQKPLTIGSEHFAHGIGVHAHSVALIDLPAGAHRFEAKVGIDDEVKGTAGSAEFVVYGDGKILWRSGVRRPGAAALSVTVDLRGVHQLKLEVTDAGDGISYDHADWAEARLFYSGSVAPVLLPDPTHIYIEAGAMSLILHVTDDSRLALAYFGARGGALPREDQGDPYISYGDGTTLAPALQVTHADGNTSTRLEFVEQSRTPIDQNVALTRIELRDPQYSLFVTLCFKTYEKESVIEQWAEIRHQEAKPVTLYRFASAAPLFSQNDYYLSSYHGSWANEMNRTEEKLNVGSKIISSRRGTQVHQEGAPAFLLSTNGPVQESRGEVFGATLAYSGNFQFQFEVATDHRLRTLCGINPDASQFTLRPNQNFVTPSMIWCYSNQGSGELARRFARWGRSYGMRDGGQPRAVLLNNWESTYFDFDEKRILTLMYGGRDLGIELFLLDDGWFGNGPYARKNDAAGLGDWQVTKDKLPHGLTFLADEAKKRGLRFGLWVEPEMVNPNSELYHNHPDWVIRQPGRTLELQRNQLVLDLANPAVREWVFATVDGILTKNPGITYIKWDCNRFVTQPGSSYLKSDEQSRLFIDYYQNFYNILERLSRKHPNVQMMNCASGGGRVDYGALRYAHEFWPSDNTDPVQRIRMQWEYEQFYPTTALAAHVTRWGNRPLKFAFDVAMSARLGLDLDTAKLSEVDRFFCRSAIATYKDIRNVVQFGDLYRLEAPERGPRVSQLYITPDKNHVVVFAWQMRSAAPSILVLQGLDPQKRYRVTERNRMAGEAVQVAEDTQVIDGATLMQKGLTLALSKELTSAMVELTAQ